MSRERRGVTRILDLADPARGEDAYEFQGFHLDAGVSFIVVNSMAGLAGNFASVQNLPGTLPVWAVAAAAGALVGTHLGTRHFQSNGIRRALAVVLVIAGLKLVLT